MKLWGFLKDVDIVASQQHVTISYMQMGSTNKNETEH